MWTVVSDIDRWRAAGSSPVVARCSAMSGLAGRRAGETLAVVPGGERSGGLLSGTADAAVLAAADRIEPATPLQVLEVEVGDAEALAAGLGCGGLARVVVQDAASLPEGLWSCLRTRRSVALASVLGAAAGGTLVVTADATEGDLGSPDLQGVVVATARALLARGREASTTVEHAHGSVLVEAFVPATRMVIVSEPAVLVEALHRQASLLGWEAEDHHDLAASLSAVEELGPGDAVVVLAHDHDLDTPVLVAAVAGPAFVGALGSRRTQQRRRERLQALGVPEEQVARVHGPVGLDLGARVPEETALAICAEIMAVRAGRDATSLSAGSGPING